MHAPSRAVLPALRAQLPHVAPHARYLGTRHAERLGIADEVPFRLQAMKFAWATLASLWYSGVTYGFRRIVYQACVRGAGLSGLEALAGSKGPLRERDVAVLHRFDLQCLRKLLQGAATARSSVLDARGGAH